MNSPVTVIEDSKNGKLTGRKKANKCSATYASQSSCPTDCAFLNSGCYAETGNASYTTRRLNAAEETDPIKIAKIEAAEIGKLRGKYDLRVHVVGDSRTNKSAEIVGQAMVDYENKSGKSAWTYTHAWKRVKASSWRGANAIASCETPEDVQRAHKLGYATSIVVDKLEDKSGKVYRKDGIKYLPCLKESRGIPCVECGICFNTKTLRKLKLTITFPAHGTSKKKAIKALKVIDRLTSAPDLPSISCKTPFYP